MAFNSFRRRVSLQFFLVLTVAAGMLAFMDQKGTSCWHRWLHQGLRQRGNCCPRGWPQESGEDDDRKRSEAP